MWVLGRAQLTHIITFGVMGRVTYETYIDTHVGFGRSATYTHKHTYIHLWVSGRVTHINIHEYPCGFWDEHDLHVRIYIYRGVGFGTSFLYVNTRHV